VKVIARLSDRVKGDAGGPKLINQRRNQSRGASRGSVSSTIQFPKFRCLIGVTVGLFRLIIIDSAEIAV